MSFNFIKKLIRPELIKPLTINTKNYIANKKYNFGDKNKSKNFYVIKLDYNFSGLFSNLTFILNHLYFAKIKKLIPVIDMENYPTAYNEIKKIEGSKNSWDYYFKTINKYSLKDVYRSSNVFFSSNKRIFKTEINQNLILKNIFKDNIKIKKNILKEANLKKKIFKKYKVLAVHIRGSLQKVVRGHSFPPDRNDILKETIKLFKKFNCEKVFLVTEDLYYYNFFKDYFKNQLISFNTPRSYSNPLGSHNLHYEMYNRKNHRYKLGKEVIIDMILLSQAKVFLYTESNVWRYAVTISKKKNRFQFLTNKNSKIKIVARWLWYLKIWLPFLFGKINYKVIKKL